VRIIKKILKALVGNQAWEKLGEARQEYFWSKKEFFCDENLIPFFENNLNYSSGYYVDIGAHDGRSKSNTYHLEKSYDWQGILVEPVIHLSLLSRKLRNSNNNFFQAAVVSPNFGKELLKMTYCDTMTISNETSEIDPTWWTSGGSKFLKESEVTFPFWATALTLETILEKSNAPREIDVLSIDTEGSEFDILKDFDFKYHFFKYIIIEALEDSKVVKLLLKNGYNILQIVDQNIILKRNPNPH